MTGPFDESLRPVQTWGTIRALAIAPKDGGGWDVALDVDDDREPHEDPRHVRFALCARDDSFQLTLPVEVLRELGERIDEL